MTLQPCPNEECRGECTLALYTAGHDGTPGLYRAECSSATCAYCGPVSYDPEQAIELHNRMPRTEPWVSVAERMPEKYDDECYVVLKTGEVFGTLQWNGTSWFWSQDNCPFTRGKGHIDDPVTHWKRHTPPRGPVSR